MQPNKYGIRIDEEYDSTNNDIAIQACPGSGKTTTLLRLLKRTPKYKKCVFLAFNKSIQQELEKKVPQGVDTTTIHGLAYRVLLKESSRRYQLNDGKYFFLLKDKLKREFKTEKDKIIHMFSVTKLLDLYRMNLCQSNEDIVKEATIRSMTCSPEELEDLNLLIGIMNKYNSQSHKDFMIDYTDMLWLTKEKVDYSKYPKYDVVMVDECQDVNPLQKHIIDGLRKKSGRMIFVGDQYQAIYGFMGATPEVFESVKRRDNTTTLPLSVCYRCGKKIVAEANKIFDNIESTEDKEDGIVGVGNLDMIKDGDFLLCRNNLPLVESFVSLLKMGKACHIYGSDLIKQIQKVLYRVSNMELGDGSVELLSWVEESKNELIKKGVKNPDKHPSIISMKENIAIVKILSMYYGGFNSLESKLDTIFNEKDSKGITLMSIHRSKGLEADRVFILGYNELIPSKYAFTKEELYQEQCLKYVAVTRAKKELYFIKYIQSNF